MDEKLLSTQDLVDNPTARVPVCLCVDASDSMNAVVEGSFTKTGKTKFADGKKWNIVSGGVSKMDKLQDGMNLFYNAIKEDDTAKDAAEISVIQFNDTVTCLNDFASIERQEIPVLSASGDTHMGEAINLALDLLEKRKAEYKDNGVDYYQPWLVIMSDGGDNGEPADMERAISRVTELVNAKKLTVFPIAIGTETDIGVLGKLSPNRPPLRIKGLKFKEFFAWLSQSIATTSQSVVGEKVVLDTEGLKQWATV